MPRSPSNTVDYFPHFAKQGKTLFILKSRFGNQGYAFWFQLLELLCREENHVYECHDDEAWQYLLAQTGVDEVSGTEILQLLVNLGKIDPELWQARRIIWCPKLVHNLQFVYNKRGRAVPKKPVAGTETGVADTETRVSGADIPQRKGKESKGNNIYSADSPEHQLATMLKDRILENNPRARVPTDLQKWCQSIHVLLSKNGYQPAEVQKVIEYCQSDSFWKPNILSAEKLRAKFDTLHLQVNEKGGQRGKTRHSRELPDRKAYTKPPVYPDD